MAPIGPPYPIGFCQDRLPDLNNHRDEFDSQQAFGWKVRSKPTQSRDTARKTGPKAHAGVCLAEPLSKRHTFAEASAPLVRVERSRAGRWSNRQIFAPNGNPSAFSNPQPTRIKPVPASAEGE